VPGGYDGHVSYFSSGCWDHLCDLVFVRLWSVIVFAWLIKLAKKEQDLRVSKEGTRPVIYTCSCLDNTEVQGTEALLA
jgi:hypothetical protein